MQQQIEFLHSLNDNLMPNTDIGTLVIGGDWNVALYAIDKKGGAAWKPHTYRDNLISMMRELELVGIFRKQNPSKLSYTYESKALNLRSRIDFFVVAQSLINCVSHIGTKVSTAPDHKAVKLILALVKERRGSGLWKFNTSLLEDKEYIKLIKENYPIITNKYSDLEDKRLKWELIKMEIRAITIPYSKNKQKNLRIKEQDLGNRLDKLDNLLSQSANADDDANEKQQEYARLKQELHLLYENKGKGSILRSKTRWIEQSK